MSTPKKVFKIAVQCQKRRTPQPGRVFLLTNSSNYYVGITLLVTLTLGTVCSLAVCWVFDQIGMFGTLTYHFSVLQVLMFGAALFLVQGVFFVCVIRHTRRLSLVERLKAMD